VTAKRQLHNGKKIFIAKVKFIIFKFSSKHKDISDLKTQLDYFAHPARNYEDEIFILFSCPISLAVRTEKPV
jgi:hypothetical protein